MSVTITADLLDDLSDFFKRAPELTTEAAMLAVNDTTRGSALRMSREEIMDQVNFPRGYLSNDRLSVAKLARRHDLEAVISGRDRATSLARFAKGAVPGRKGPISVEVHKGSTKIIKKGFFIKLRSGRTMDGTTFNVGLAIRLAPGETLQNKRFAPDTFATSSLGKGVVLLYGPSVDQVFRWVADDIQPDVANDLTAEFFRQFARLSSK